MTYKTVIKEIKINNFRNHHSKKISSQGKNIVITGNNGIGKTNILEAVSFLTAGRGMRKVRLDHINRIDNNTDQSQQWVVSAKINTTDGEYNIGTGNLNSGNNKRIIRIDNKNAKNQQELSSVLNIMWVIPQMDRTFLDGNTKKRKFLDRIFYSFDIEHATRVNKYEYYMRERLKLLSNNGNPTWISTVEQKMAESAIAITVARTETLDRLQHVIDNNHTIFPKAILSIDGIIESNIGQYSSLQLEEKFAKILYNNQDRGRATNDGVHLSNIQIIHSNKNIIAELCSTSEQKILLLAIILAQTKAVSLWYNRSPILLLDEVMAHLDAKKRQALFNEINALQLQYWMTGIDKEIFAGLEDFIHVEL